MAQQKIIDLDAAVPENVKVKMGGEVYELPNDVPIPDYLEIARLVDRLGEESEDAAETLEALYEKVIELFRIAQPEIEDLPIGVKRIAEVLLHIYGQEPEPDGDGARPPSRPRAGTRSTSRTKSRKSASSRS
jgi:hypothetical protein